MTNRESLVTIYAQFRAESQKQKDEALAAEQNVQVIADNKVREAQALAVIQPPPSDAIALKEEVMTMRNEIVRVGANALSAETRATTYENTLAEQTGRGKMIYEQNQDSIRRLKDDLEKAHKALSDSRGKVRAPTARTNSAPR